MQTKLNVEPKNLPEWVQKELKDNNSKPSDIAVYIADNDTNKVFEEIDRLQAQIANKNIMAWAVDRNKQLITYLTTSIQNIKNPASVHIHGHEGQRIKFYNLGDLVSTQACYNESWGNSTGIEQLFSTGLLYILKPGEMVLTRYHYGNCKHAYSLYVHPNDFSTLQLPSTKELTIEEKIVLCATRSYKGSYAGDKNARFTEATWQTGIKLQAYKQAEQELVQKGLLRKVGQGLGLTTEGRNLSENLNLYGLKLNP